MIMQSDFTFFFRSMGGIQQGYFDFRFIFGVNYLAQLHNFLYIRYIKAESREKSTDMKKERLCKSVVKRSAEDVLEVPYSVAKLYRLPLISRNRPI